jgi:hypothetical protein
MTKKVLDISQLSNELDEASAFFRREPLLTPLPARPAVTLPQGELTTEVFRSPSPHPVGTTNVPLPITERKSERSENRTEARTENRSDGLPTKRKTRRYSFEFYDDQLLRLKRLKYRVEMSGENITLSVMVRQAVDHYLKEQGE